MTNANVGKMDSYDLPPNQMKFDERKVVIEMNELKIANSWFPGSGIPVVVALEML